MKLKLVGYLSTLICREFQLIVAGILNRSVFLPEIHVSMFDLINKLGDVKKKMEEIKARLDTITVDGASPSGLVTVTVTGNRMMKSVSIAPELLHPDRKEELEEMVEMATNQALDKANQVSETEMKAAGRDFLPGFPGF